MYRTDSEKGNISLTSSLDDPKDALDKKNIAFQSLFSLIEKLGTTLDLEKVIRLLLNTLMGQIRLRKVCFYLPAADRQSIIPYHSMGLGRDAGLPEITAECGFVRWLESIESFVHIDRFYNTQAEGTKGCKHLDSLLEKGFAYALPMKGKNETVGIIFLSDKVVEEPIHDFDIDLMLMISRVASITIRNAWLYRKICQAKTELENFAKIKKQFINHTSHELRTPLTIINSALDFIQTNEKEESMMDMVKKAVSDLKGKVELLLSLNDIELKDSTDQPQILNIYSILQECVEEIKADIEENRIDVSLKNNAGSGGVLADYSKMKIVFRSLIDNALNYVQNGGRIDITVGITSEQPGKEDGIELRRWGDGIYGDYPWDGDNICTEQPAAEVTANPAGEESADCPTYLVVRIKDNGIGIPESEIASLSRPFERASNSPLANVRGMGIGLSISQRIISGFGGKLFCRSEENSGSEFSVFLQAYR